MSPRGLPHARLPQATCLVASVGLLITACGEDTGPSGPVPNAVWSKHAGNPVLTSGPAGSWDGRRVASPFVLAYSDTSYAMWYTGVDSTTTRIGLATSADGIQWRKYAGNPVFSPGAPGRWDAAGVESPCVLYDGIEYTLFYTGRGSAGRAIGVATSRDGIQWARQPEPVLLPTPTTPYWDDTDVYAPWVRSDGPGFEMWYTGRSVFRQIGYATSADGQYWTKLLSPVIQAQVLEAVSFEPCILATGSILRIWYGAQHESVGGGAFPGVIDTAQSINQVDWSGHRTVLLPGDAGSWDDGGVGAPCVIGDGKGERMWYEGSHGLVPGDPSQGTSAIGLATAP